MNLQNRITCSVRDALAASGLGKTKFYSLMDAGRVETIKIDGKRLVRVESLLKLLGDTRNVENESDPAILVAALHERRAKLLSFVEKIDETIASMCN
jgi:hypothetical protein